MRGRALIAVNAPWPLLCHERAQWVPHSCGTYEYDVEEAMTEDKARKRIVIMGAAGRDFHDFNMLYREDPGTEVVAFTAAQIPGIAGRRYPPSLAGPLYPEGIPIEKETDLATICLERNVDTVVFAYSDLSHEEVMHKASTAIAAGADFLLPGADRTMISVPVPVIAVCAVRTGCGKSQVARHLSRHLLGRGLRAAVLRHPMPYGVLERQAVQRFETLEDLRAANCTVEEREEYEPHIAAGNVVFAGVDYARIAEAASAEADIIIWDGGNNDIPFLRPDVMLTLVDPLRPGDETTYHPGEAVLRMADMVLIAKANSATAEDIATTVSGLRQGRGRGRFRRPPHRRHAAYRPDLRGLPAYRAGAASGRVHFGSA